MEKCDFAFEFHLEYTIPSNLNPGYKNYRRLDERLDWCRVFLGSAYMLQQIAMQHLSCYCPKVNHDIVKNPRKMRFCLQQFARCQRNRTFESLHQSNFGWRRLPTSFITFALFHLRQRNKRNSKLGSTAGLCPCTHPVVSIHHGRGCGDIGRPVMLRKTREKDEDGNVVWRNVHSWMKSKNLALFGLHDYPRDPRVIVLCRFLELEQQAEEPRGRRGVRGYLFGDDALGSEASSPDCYPGK